MSGELNLIIVAAVAVVVVLLIVWMVMRKRRTERLRQRFGPEYDHTARLLGDTGRAELALEARARRVERLHIRRLTAEDAERFTKAWRDVQRRFVDDPHAATTDADRLVGEVMHARGYPVGDFDQRVDDVSVDHPKVVSNYRAARDIATRHARGEASTEDLRQAMVHYRTLFNELLEVTPDSTETRHPVSHEPELAKERR